MAAPKIDIDALNFTADKMINADREAYQKEAEEGQKAREKEKREVIAQKSIDKANQAFIKVAVQAQKDTKKEEVKFTQDVEEAQKKDILHKIGLYVTRFPFLSEKIPRPSPKASVIELNAILDLVRTEMDTQRSLAQVSNYAQYGFMFVESVWGNGKAMTFVPEQLRFDLTGLTQMAAQGAFQAELLPLIMEIDIEYPWIGRQSLLVRSMETLSKVLLQVHVYNTNPAARKLMNLARAGPAGVDVNDL
jgi:hypothetical protein